MVFRAKVRMAATAAAFAVALGAGVLAAVPQASAAVSSGPNQTGYELAYEGTTDNLLGFNCQWPSSTTLGGCNGANTGLGMAAGTSPSITTVNLTSYEMAFQANTSALWITGSLGTGSLGLGMMPGTSPSITALTDGGYEIAFQANTGVLWVAGSDGTGPIGTTMNAKSSPSIAPEISGGYEVAYQDSSDNLEIAGSLGTGSLGLAMAAGTDPSIMSPRTGGYEIAYDAANSALSTVGSLMNGSVGWNMWPGTSPDITYAPPTTTNPDGGFEIAFQYTDGRLFGYGALLSGPVTDPRSPSGIAIAPGSSPAVAGIIMPTYLGGGEAPSFEMFYEDPTGNLRYVLGSAFSSAYLNPASAIGPVLPGTIPSVASFAQ